MYMITSIHISCYNCSTVILVIPNYGYYLCSLKAISYITTNKGKCMTMISVHELSPFTPHTIRVPKALMSQVVTVGCFDHV